MANHAPTGPRLSAVAFFGGVGAPVMPIMMMGMCSGGSLFSGEALARLFPPMGGAPYRICPACGARLRPSFRYCMECGAKQEG